MKKKFSGILVGTLLALGATAHAINPGHYVNQRYAAADGFMATYGEIKICRLEGFANLPKIEVFSLITRDGMEPMECYAGIINQNGPARATGTLMYKLTNNERIAALRGPQKGTWLADINSTENDIRFNLRDEGKIGFAAIDGKKLPIYCEDEFKYINNEIQDEGIAVMKIVALAKVRSLIGKSFNVKDQSYRLCFTQGNNEILEVYEQGKKAEYQIFNNLSGIRELKSGGGYTELLVGSPDHEGIFGNAICTADEVLVRNESSREGEIVAVLNKNERVIYCHAAKGEQLGESNVWIYVKLNNGKRGYVFGKYIKLKD